MARILGLDLGTNSLGWAVSEKEDGSFKLIDKGVSIFQEGVKEEKGIEISRAAERTGYRSMRRRIKRRKQRKIDTLKVLSENNFCPKLSELELKNWRNHKIYPKDNNDFMDWLRIDDLSKKNPYYFRNKSLNVKLNLDKREERLILGRALYHLSQRRGFLSNRLETTKESEGDVKSGISELTNQIEKAGFNYLGEYFYYCYENGLKIRNRYTSRKEHYIKEFYAICNKQQLNNDLTESLFKAIFYQRPLKSQRGLVGKCPLEKRKARCPISHPRFEEFRMYSFLNNIKIKTPILDDVMRPLNEEEKRAILHLFMRKSKANFKFEDLAKALTPKAKKGVVIYSYYKDREPKDKNGLYLFNYPMHTSVSGNPTLSQLVSIFGEDWEQAIVSNYKDFSKKKSTEEIINEVWHTLFTFDDEEKIKEYAINKLSLNNEGATEFSKISLKRDYASLSLSAINRINPFLKAGLLYSHSVFLAKLPDILPKEIWQNREDRDLITNSIIEIIDTQIEEEAVIQIINGLIKRFKDEDARWPENEIAQNEFLKEIPFSLSLYFGRTKWEELDKAKKDRLTEESKKLFVSAMKKNIGRGDFLQVETIESRFKQFLIDNFEIDPKKLELLYHPSAIEVFKEAKREADGKYYLGSPRTSSVRNPMAMRSLFRLRKLLNELIKEGLIDRNTKINIEMARDLNNANERKAIETYQREREKERSSFIEKIKEHMGLEYEPSEDEVLKYQLWEEQNRICLYTGKTIGLAEFLGPEPKYDIEHTIPRSRSSDDSQENKTLADNRFNREVKGNKIPFELENHSQILERIEDWKAKVYYYNEEIENRKVSYATKEAKDRQIQYRHKLKYYRDYWRGKIKRFEIKEVNEGFKNSQLVDIGIITKYARLYLSSVFPKVYTVKGSAVASFRKAWGLEDEFEKKVRDNHIHHTIDAITMSCMDKAQYEAIAHFYRNTEFWERGNGSKPHFEKPWPTFTEDIKAIGKEVFASHYTSDVLLKQSKKKLRIRGVIQKNSDGKVKYQQGDSVRAPLHLETFYGAIKPPVGDPDSNNPEKVKYVVRKSLSSLKESDIKNIVDDTVRSIVEKAISQKGFKTAMSQTIWMNEEKAIPINKVRLFVPSVTNPIKLKKHRDLSKHDYKHHLNASNDSNYMMALYESISPKGKVLRDFKLVSNFEAAKSFKSVKAGENLDLVPELSPKGYPLKYILKLGTMVIFWLNSPDEIWDLSIEEMGRRLYKVVGLSTLTIQEKFFYSRITFKHHLEARPSTDLKVINREYSLTEYYPMILLLHTQLNCLVEGVDFKITDSGKLIRIKND